MSSHAAATRSLKVRHRFPVPHVRLPVGNTELAILKRSGQPTLLAAAAYSNLSTQIVLVDLEGNHRLLPFPQGRGGWLMKADVGPDANGNLICGCNDLLRIDPWTGKWEILAKDIIPNDGIWGGGVFEKHIVCGGSTPDGTLAFWERATGRVVKSVAPVHPKAFYTYNVVQAPDGAYVAQSALPEAVLLRIDPGDLSFTARTLEHLGGAKSTFGAQFVAPDVLYLHDGERALLLKYPSMELLREAPAPDGLKGWSRRTALRGGRVLAWGNGANNFYELDAERGRWTPLLDRPLLPHDADRPESVDAFACLDDGSLCGLTRAGLLFRVPPGARKAETKQLHIAGPHNGQAMRVASSSGFRKAYGSSHVLQRFWEVDLETGAGRDGGDSGPGGGQVNDMLWDEKRRKLYMASYTSCTLVEYDPAKGGAYPQNPRVLARVGHGQMRPLQLLAQGDHAWMTTSPLYGTLGGALVRIDLDSGATDVFRNETLLPAQTPSKMLLAPGGRALYLSSTIHGDCDSAVPQAPAGMLAVFDTKARRLVRSFAPLPGCGTVTLLALLPEENGRRDVLFQSGKTFAKDAVLYRWAPDGGDRIERLGKAPSQLREVFEGPASEGAALWATGADGVGPLLPGDPARIENRLEETVLRSMSAGMAKFLQWEGPLLWASLGTEIAAFEAE